MAQKEYLDYEGLTEFKDKLDEEYGSLAGGIEFKGTVATISGLPTVSGVTVGSMYNVTTGGTTTADFVEGAGKTLQDGENVVCINTGTEQSPVHKWDIIGGVFTITDRLQYGSTMPSTPVNGQAYLYLGETTYTYDAVQNPTGNPKAQGWYEYDSQTEQYILTNDEEVQSGTSYFVKNEQYVNGTIYEYNSAQTKWVAKTSGDTMIPITKAKIDALFV